MSGRERSRRVPTRRRRGCSGRGRRRGIHAGRWSGRSASCRRPILGDVVMVDVAGEAWVAAEDPVEVAARQVLNPPATKLQFGAGNLAFGRDDRSRNETVGRRDRSWLWSPAARHPRSGERHERGLVGSDPVRALLAKERRLRCEREDGPSGVRARRGGDRPGRPWGEGGSVLSREDGAVTILPQVGVRTPRKVRRSPDIHPHGFHRDSEPLGMNARGRVGRLTPDASTVTSAPAGGVRGSG